MLMKHTILKAIAGTAILLLLSGCGGLSSEPQIVSTLIPPTVEPTQIATVVAPTAVSTAAATTVQAAVPTVQMTPAATSPAGTESAVSTAAVVGRVTGIVTNGTAGASVPSSVALTLHMLNGHDAETTKTATSDAKGTYEFKDVPISQDMEYVVTATYKDRIVSSDFVMGDPANTTMTIPITLYEQTSDPVVLNVTSMIMQVNASGGQLEIAQVYHIKNTSDKLFTTDKKIADNQYTSVMFALPAGAKLEGFMDSSNRFVLSEDGRTVADTQPVAPNEDHVVHYIYTMPYRPEGTVVDQVVPYAATNASAQLIMSPTSITATSQQLSAQGVQTMGDSSFQSYSGLLNLKSGDTLHYQVQGSVADTTTTTTASTAPTTGGISKDLIIGFLVGGGLGLIGVGFIFLFRERRQMNKESTKAQVETLVNKLAQLDERHEQGHISHSAYRKEREKMKLRLAKLMKE